MNIIINIQFFGISKLKRQIQELEKKKEDLMQCIQYRDCEIQKLIEERIIASKNNEGLSYLTRLAKQIFLRQEDKNRTKKFTTETQAKKFEFLERSKYIS